MSGGAVISADGKYRYLLTRSIPQTFTPAGAVAFIMLNPSTADADTDDPTIRKCIGFAARWGVTELRVVNLYAYRATDPRELAKVDDPCGPENDRYVREAVEGAHRVVAAWGAWPREPFKPFDFCPLPAEMYCLGTTKNGSPRHPLYVSYDTPLELWP